MASMSWQYLNQLRGRDPRYLGDDASYGDAWDARSKRRAAEKGARQGTGGRGVSPGALKVPGLPASAQQLPPGAWPEGVPGNPRTPPPDPTSDPAPSRGQKAAAAVGTTPAAMASVEPAGTSIAPGARDLLNAAGQLQGLGIRGYGPAPEAEPNWQEQAGRSVRDVQRREAEAAGMTFKDSSGLGDGEAMNSFSQDSEPMSMGELERRSGRAFLDAPDSLEGMRRKRLMYAAEIERQGGDLQGAAEDAGLMRPASMKFLRGQMEKVNRGESLTDAPDAYWSGAADDEGRVAPRGFDPDYDAMEDEFTRTIADADRDLAEHDWLFGKPGEAPEAPTVAAPQSEPAAAPAATGETSTLLDDDELSSLPSNLGAALDQGLSDLQNMDLEGRNLRVPVGTAQINLAYNSDGGWGPNLASFAGAREPRPFSRSDIGFAAGNALFGGTSAPKGDLLVNLPMLTKKEVEQRRRPFSARASGSGFFGNPYWVG